VSVTTSKPVAAIVGTDRLGRPLTAEERARFGRLLREHGYVDARLIALNFARKLTRGRGSAHDLMGRVDLRLVRQGWDPGEVPLVKRLCRLVWSEWTHEAETSIAARRAEEVFLVHTQGPDGGRVTSHAAMPSREQAAAAEQLERLRAAFEAAGDEVNLLWLQYQREDITDLQEIANLSGRAVEEFYRAAERRKRHVRRLIAQKNGVKVEESE
jgi:hypothetical protein